VDENNNYRNVERVPDLVGRLYEIVSELEGLFPGRHFTPDGHPGVFEALRRAESKAVCAALAD